MLKNKETNCKYFSEIKDKWGELDFVVHAVAFSDKSELSGEYLNTTRDNFLRSMLISCFSFTSCKRSCATDAKRREYDYFLTYEGLQKTIPNYNVMGVCKSTLETSTKYLARDLGKNGIRVNAISAGPIKNSCSIGNRRC